MDMVRPWKDPWGLSPSLRPWEAWAVLTDLCSGSSPMGPPRSSPDAYVGPACHCHCRGDRRSQHIVGLVWVNGSFECRTIAARTGDLTLHMLLIFTSIYRLYLLVLTELHQCPGIITISVKNRGHVEMLTQLWDCRGKPPPVVVLGTCCHAWV